MEPIDDLDLTLMYSALLTLDALREGDVENAVILSTYNSVISAGVTENSDYWPLIHVTLRNIDEEIKKL